MSSITGDTQSAEPSLQLAPREGDGPDFPWLKKAWEDCIRDVQPFVSQCEVNFQTRYALWPGQSADGKKHAREGAKVDPTPWDGASDLRVYLTDEAINSKVAMQCMAFRKANLVAVPVEGNDLKRAKTVSNFMRWLIQTQIPEIDREVELLSNILNEKGVAATGQFWERCQEKTLTNVTLEDLQAQFQGVDVAQMLESGIVDDDLAALFERTFGCSGRKAKKMVRELREDGKTTVATVGREYSRPIIRAFSLDENLFIPSYATDLETAPGIYRVEYFTAEQLRAFVRTDGWDEDWVEKAIETQRGKWLSATPPEYLYPISRSFIWQEQRFHELIGVVYAYQRLSDEDGVPGIYLTVFNPNLSPDDTHKGYAKFGLLGYAHGQYPFVLHRREYLSRKLHDSRGIPEPGKPWQDQIKAHRDSLIDAASLAILPPLMYPIGRPPARWGAGARVPERRPGEYHFADRPAPDISTEKSEQILSDTFNRYFGFISRETDPTFSGLKNQQDVDKFLSGWCKAYRQVFALYKQFGDEKVAFRVIGLQQADAAIFDKGDPRESMDFYLSFDVQSTDFEMMGQKLEAIAKAIATGDKYGQVDYAQWLQVMLEAIDPNIAERIIRPENVGAAQAQKEEKDALSKIFSGFDEDISLGAPPQIGMQVIQQWAQTPDIMQRLQQDEPFKERVEKRYKQYQFQITQQQNAKIGRFGA